MPTLSVTTAFRLLGVSPDADAVTIRKAWRALVREYHPDQFRGDKEAANRRLAEINAAFDVASSWTPETANTRADRPKTSAKTTDSSAKRTAQSSGSTKNRAETATQRAAFEAAARARADALNRRDAARAAARAQARRRVDAPRPLSAQARFLETLKALSSTRPRTTLGFA
ncbi:MAG: J domain-containing protein [Pseudomonadota bacterium]